MKEKTKKPLTEYKLTESISIVSHQLKTPLSAIKGYLEVLLAGDLGKINKKQKEYLDDALENAVKMSELVKNLLDVSRIEENRIDLHPKWINLEKIVKEAVNDFTSLAKAKNCEIFLKVADNTPKVYVDPLRVKQAVNNLISNAIEYNKRRGRVEVSLEKEKGEVVFCCKDVGIGIPEADKEKIFKKFYRSEKTLSLTTEGTGLGLFISKAFIEKSGGKIWFKSKEEEGSKFCFSFPAKKHE